MHNGKMMNAALGPKIVLSAIAVLLILGYAYFRMGNLMHGPRIVLTAPHNGALVASPLIRIEGTTKNSATLVLNGRAIFMDETGKFAEVILVARGYNVFEVSAKDRFGRTATEKIEVMRK